MQPGHDRIREWAESALSATVCNTVLHMVGKDTLFDSPI